MGIVGLKTPSSDITIVESSISHELHPQSREIWASAARLVSSLFPLHLPPARLEDVKKVQRVLFNWKSPCPEKPASVKTCYQCYVPECVSARWLTAVKSPRLQRVPSQRLSDSCLHPCCCWWCWWWGQREGGGKKEIYSLRGRRTMPAHGGSSYVGGCSGMEPGLDNVT